MRGARLLKLLLLVVSVSGVACTRDGASIYPFADNERSTPLKLLNIGKATMCKNGKLYELDSTKRADLRIPVGEPVTFGTMIYFVAPEGKFACEPKLSFTPTEWETYILHGGVRDGICFLEVVREDVGSPTGVSLEYSAGPPNCEVDAENPSKDSKEKV
jgi:hypothetical protein